MGEINDHWHITGPETIKVLIPRRFIARAPVKQKSGLITVSMCCAQFSGNNPMLFSVSASKVNLAGRIVHVELIKAEISNLMLQIMALLLQNKSACLQVFIALWLKLSFQVVITVSNGDYFSVSQNSIV